MKRDRAITPLRVRMLDIGVQISMGLVRVSELQMGQGRIPQHLGGECKISFLFEALQQGESGAGMAGGQSGIGRVEPDEGIFPKGTLQTLKCHQAICIIFPGVAVAKTKEEIIRVTALTGYRIRIRKGFKVFGKKLRALFV